MPDADLLALLRHGPLDALSLCQRLAISQPTLSRRIAQAGDAIVRIGRARATRYLARRAVRAQHSFVLYQVDASGQATPWGELIPVHPGFVWRANNGTSRWSEGLPWWLQDMRPQGFLGRAWGRARASALALPDDAQDWSDEHVLIALAAGEADAPGNLPVWPCAHTGGTQPGCRRQRNIRARRPVLFATHPLWPHSSSGAG